MARLELSNRAKIILKAIDDFLAAHAAWAESDVEYPPASYWDALSEMFEVYFGAEGVPAILRGRLDVAVANLRTEDAKMDLIDTPEIPNTFWVAREALEWSRHWFETTLAGPQPIDSVALLNEQGVPHPQIARIWGLVRNGVEETHLIVKELAKTGSVITKAYREEWEDARYWKYLEDCGLLVDGEVSHPVDPAPKSEEIESDSPETWEDLFYQGVTADQAAAMKRVDIAEAIAQFEALERQSRGVDAVKAYVPPKPVVNEYESQEGKSLQALKLACKQRGIEIKPKSPKMDYLKQLIEDYDAAMAAEGAANVD